MRFKAGLLSAVLISGAAFSQTTIRTDTTLVLVPTLVQTPGRELAFSLTTDDFLLRADGVPQKLMLEEESKSPLSLVVLIQTGGAARGQFESYGHLETLLEEILGKAPNRISIVNFDSRVEGVSPFTSDVSQWNDAINHPDVGDKGAAIFDSISFALNLLKHEPANTRRVILIISQGHDDGSKTSLKDLLRTISETNTAIYSVTFSAELASIKQAFKEPAHLNPPIAGHGQNYFDIGAPLALALGAMKKNLAAEVANLSGGEASSFDSRNELESDLEVVANHIRNRYVLSFYPTSKEPGLHTISVRLAHHPDFLISARRNYWSSELPSTPR